MTMAGTLRLFRNWLEDISTIPIDELSGAEAGRVLRDMQLLRAFFDQCERNYLYRYDQSGEWAAEGARSAPTAIALATNAARARLALQLRIATGLRQLPASGDAATAGLLNSEHCRSLAELVGPVDPAMLAEGEAMLVEQGSQLCSEDFAVVCRRFHDVAEAAAATGNERTGPGEPEPEPRSVGKRRAAIAACWAHQHRSSIAEHGPFAATTHVPERLQRRNIVQWLRELRFDDDGKLVAVMSDGTRVPILGS